MWSNSNTHRITFILIAILLQIHASKENDCTVKEKQPDIPTVTAECRKIGSLQDLLTEVGSDRWRKLKIRQSDQLKLQKTGFTKNPDLEILDLTGNKVDAIPGQAFTGLAYLVTLILRDMGLFYIHVGAFDLLTNLEELDLHGNELTKISPGMFRGLSTLQVLNLDHNRLVSVEDRSLDSLISLRTLDLSHNFLHTLRSSTFSGLARLETLHLHDNVLVNITPLTFEHMPILDALDLSSNELTIVPSQAFLFTSKTLSSLRLRNNSLNVVQSASFATLQNLRLLDLSENFLQSLPNDALIDLFALRTLDVSRNLLEWIPPALLDSAQLIQDLRFAHNRLTFWPVNSRNFWTHLKTMRIEGNPWQCECLYQIMVFAEKNNVAYDKDLYFTGKRPVCVVTDLNYCLRDVASVKASGIVASYEKEHPRLNIFNTSIAIINKL